MLYIICNQSYRYQKAIDAICQKIGLKDYQVLDPKSYEMDRPFTYVLIVGSYNGEKPKAKAVWQTEAPDPELDKEAKLKIFEDFKKIQKYLLTKKEPERVDETEIPRLKDFEEFLQSHTGQVIEIKLSDGRLMGIYPDNERLQMKYPVENHASTILNLARLKNLFDVKQIIIKDV